MYINSYSIEKGYNYLFLGHNFHKKGLQIPEAASKQH